MKLSEDLKASSRFEILLDSALTVPPSPTSGFIEMEVRCDDSKKTRVIHDYSSMIPEIPSSDSYYYISSSSNDSIIEFSYGSLSSYAGFTSWFSFNLTLDKEEFGGFWVDLDFDGDFDAIPGPTNKLDEYEDLLLISAMDGNGYSILCFASHWIVSCEIPSTDSGFSTITIWLLLYNGQDSGRVSAYITDNENNLLYNPAYSDKTITFVNSLEKLIDLYYAVAQPTDETKLSVDLELKAFVDIEAKKGETFLVRFPYPFDLKVIQDPLVSCSLIYYNNDEAKETVDVVIKKSYCEINENMVLFTLTQDKTFTSTNWTLFNIYGIETPFIGFKRNPWVYDGETLDYASGLFSILYSDSNAILGASFDNLNAAFTEFNEIENYFRLVVNGGNKITVTPGTICGPYIISSTDGNISAYLIDIKATEDVEYDEEASIYLSDDGYYSVDYINLKAKFYVGAQTGTELGIYYIKWEIDETTFDGQDPKYLKPINTLIEVSYKNTYEIFFEPSDYIFVPPGLTSLPISVIINSLNVVPYSEVGISLTSNESFYYIDIYPNPFYFDENNLKRYFIITCEDCIEGESYNIFVNVVGDDDKAFYAIEYISFIYDYQYIDTATIEVFLENITSTGFEYYINSYPRNG